MNIPYIFKRCSECGQWLVANKINFHKHKQCKYGLRNKCKKCQIEYCKQYYQDNKEHLSEYQKQYNEKNKEIVAEKKKQYNEKNKEIIAEYKKQYYQDNKEHLSEVTKKYRQTPQGQVAYFNASNRRRQKKEQQGRGITNEQWLEMMEFFNWKGAYSGIYLGGKQNKNRSIDHIIPLDNGGLNEPWNCVPMERSLNSSKNKKDMLTWYKEQEFYSEERLAKIYEWQEYAFNKWGQYVAM